MGQTLDAAVKPVTVAEIVYAGEQIIIPDGMTIATAIEVLHAREKYLDTKVQLRQDYNVFPWDGANALNKVICSVYGWAQLIPTQTFFGEIPPQLVSVDVGPGPRDKVDVPWGKFTLPGVDGVMNTSITKIDGRICFRIEASIKRKDEATVRRIMNEVQEELKRSSIYRGKAIRLRFRNDDGGLLEVPEPKFMDVDRINTSMLIFSDSVTRQIETNLFTPITRVADCRANGIAVKRGVLMGGVFGTGKTLAASVASKLAVEAGVTFLYVPRADELSDAVQFAKQYQEPACVIFCEDIDRVMNGERSVKMDDVLNIVDGIDSKNSNIIIVLTTNELEQINPAMLRPGRLDAVINVTPPDAVAVQRLLRFYGSSAIRPDTDLTLVGEHLDGKIPAVVAEVVKRAKLAQLSLQPVGQPVVDLSEEALLQAAQTMVTQLDLLDRATRVEAPTPDIETALHGVVRKAMAPAVTPMMGRQVKEIHKATIG